MVCKSCQIQQQQLYLDSDGTCGQIICYHDQDDDDNDDEINQSDEEFPTVKEFKHDCEEEKAAIPFRDLPLNEVFQIKEINTVNVNTKDGVGMILHLVNKKKEEINVWATSLVQKKVRWCCYR